MKNKETKITPNGIRCVCVCERNLCASDEISTDGTHVKWN